MAMSAIHSWSHNQDLEISIFFSLIIFSSFHFMVEVAWMCMLSLPPLFALAMNLQENIGRQDDDNNDQPRNEH